MGKFDGYLLCSDIDGTLTDADGGISDGNKEAIEYFQSNGGLFTVSTGRMAGYIDRFADRFRPNTKSICVNGTLLYDDAERCSISALPMQEEEMMATVMEMLTEHHDLGKVCFYNETKIIAIRGDELRADPEALYRNPEYVAGATWLKINFIQDKSLNEGFVITFNGCYEGRFAYDRSWPGGFEMYSAKAGKGVMMNILRECAGKPIHTTVAVGDYDNDVQMLRMADIGYAVDNATPGAKAAADRVTVNHADDAIVRIISELD